MRRKKKKRFSVKVIISLLIAFILISSMLAVLLGNTSSGNPNAKLEYNNYLFSREQDYWTFESDGHNIKVTSFPSSVENINLDDEIIQSIRSTKMVYLTSPTQGENLDYIGLSVYDLSIFLNEMGIYPVVGISDNNKGYNLPLIDCTNATIPVPVILFNQSNQTQISKQGNCIILESSGGIEFVFLKDRLILGYLGVI